MIKRHTQPRDELLRLLDRGFTVVTANIRLAGAILRSFEQRAMDNGRQIWSTPQVLPWSTWVRQCWEDAVVCGALPAPALLLSAQQERGLWEKIVDSTNLAGAELQQVPGTARRARDAWQALRSWRLPLDESVFAYNDDSRAFWEWASLFGVDCADRNWLPTALLPEQLHDCIKAGTWTAPTGLVLTGFDELTPQHHSLLQALIESGCEVHWLELEGRVAQTGRVGCTDARYEVATLARWVRQRLDDNPDARIGVVVPELVSQRSMLVHALDEVLVPQALQPGYHALTRPYNVSLGQPLSESPVISTALTVLALLAETISLENASSLLRSPFLAGWEKEAGARALLDRQLRETGELRVSLKTLRRHAARTDKPYACPLLGAGLEAWLDAAADCAGQAGAGQWSQRFTRLLRAVGWGRGRTLSSEEYQATEAWREALGVFAALEPVTGPMKASTAVGQLRRTVAERLFQPLTEPAPVQVLGMLEAIGLEFDHVWVMGLHDEAWPTSPRPNPFIPLPLQREVGLPHASEERELQMARAITARLLSSADEVVVSYPQRHGEEELRPSPLIADVRALEHSQLELWTGETWRDRVYRAARLCNLEHDRAPAVEGDAVRGGSTVFKYQAACPFRAFAELRLGARPLGRLGIGLDVMSRGSLMHRVMEKVWDRLESHERLCVMDTLQLDGLVGEIVWVAIDEIARWYPQTFTDRFRVVEAHRLRRQALQWLALEKQRQPFRVVAKEQKLEATIAGVGVRLKIDRIDTLTDGRRVLIDYKTGKVQASQWFGDRPDEPQLPLYSMAAGGTLCAVLFAQLQAGAMAFKGVVEDDRVVPGVKPYDKLAQTREAGSWNEVLRDWRVVIEQLGEAFRNGDARVDPKDYPRTCLYCELKPLCRIYELRSLDAGEHSGAEEGK